MQRLRSPHSNYARPSIQAKLNHTSEKESSSINRTYGSSPPRQNGAYTTAEHVCYRANTPWFPRHTKGLVLLSRGTSCRGVYRRPTGQCWSNPPRSPGHCWCAAKAAWSTNVHPPQQQRQQRSCSKLEIEKCSRINFTASICRASVAQRSFIDLLEKLKIQETNTGPMHSPHVQRPPPLPSKPSNNNMKKMFKISVPSGVYLPRTKRCADLWWNRASTAIVPQPQWRRRHCTCRSTLTLTIRFLSERMRWEHGLHSTRTSFENKSREKYNAGKNASLSSKQVPNFNGFWKNIT